MPKFQLIYIISHETGNSTRTHKKIKRTLKFMKVIHKYIYLIYSTQSILFTWSKNGRWSQNTIINNNNKNKTCKWSLECYMVIKWKTSKQIFHLHHNWHVVAIMKTFFVFSLGEATSEATEREKKAERERLVLWRGGGVTGVSSTVHKIEVPENFTL